MSRSVISWNILAQRFVNPETFYFIEDAKILEYSRRLPLIIKKLKQSNSDIICLQEVELKNVKLK
jgi:mRNA deadenylase 3'-5' endonuclease subunit Ccr4